GRWPREPVGHSPLARPARGSWRRPPATRPSARVSRMSGHKILLVEDNEDNRLVYRTILDHFGFQVLEAADGEEGIRRARADGPDLILMDVSIPKIDGWEATRHLKADPTTSMIPIIAHTAHALATDRAKAQEAGCDGYLAKPVEPRKVVEEVRKHLKQKSGGYVLALRLPAPRRMYPARMLSGPLRATRRLVQNLYAAGGLLLVVGLAVAVLGLWALAELSEEVLQGETLR